MPHYKNGREAKVGDAIVSRMWNGLPTTGILVSVQPGSQTCNGSIVPTANAQSVTLSDCLHADDVFPVDVETATPSLR